MTNNLQDLYSDYLISQNKYATATGLADIVPENLSHDQITRFLNGDLMDSKILWQEVKADVRANEDKDCGVLVLDDMPAEKPYTDENEIIAWHYSHAKNRLIKGMNLLTCMVRYDDVRLPIGYEVVKKDLRYSDLETRKEKRKSSVSKNELFRCLISQAIRNQVKYKYVLADNWFSSNDNMNFIHHNTKKMFIMGLKANRSIAMTLEDKQQGCYEKLGSMSLEDNMPKTVYLKGVSFPVQVMKKVFTNEDGSKGVLYLVTDDLSINGEQIFETYQKRWCIEEYHKSVKQNAGFERSPTKTITSQLNHVFCSILAFCKLERLKIRTCMNHFAIKYKLIMRSNQIALQELQKMTM